MTSRIRAYMACSLDGFIAGPNNDITWLNDPSLMTPGEATDALEFETFMAQVGAMLMGRTTYDVVEAMGVWPYGETPVLVATNRTLNPTEPTIRPVAGGISELLDQALEAADGKDVYLDGGNLIHQALNAGRLDEITMTLIPVLLGAGTRLFEGLEARRKVIYGAPCLMGRMVQVSAQIQNQPGA